MNAPREKGIPLPSVDQIKTLVYQKSGYKMQIGSDDDPLLTVIYLNQVVIGAAIDYAKAQFSEENKDHLKRIRDNYNDVFDQIKDARGIARVAKCETNSIHETPEEAARRNAAEQAERDKLAAIHAAANTGAQAGVVAKLGDKDIAKQLGALIDDQQRFANTQTKTNQIIMIALFASLIVNAAISYLSKLH